MKIKLIIILLLVAGIATSCAVQDTGIESEENVFKSISESAGLSGIEQESYKIQPGDQLEIKFFYNSDLNASAVVRPDGKVALQLVGEVQAAGLTLNELDEQLTKKYGAELLNPEITINLSDFQGLLIYVGGEVNNQGYIVFRNNMTPLQAVLIAGGFTENANPGSTVVIRKDQNNKTTSIVVDLAMVLAGKNDDADLSLLPDDIVYVPKIGQ